MKKHTVTMSTNPQFPKSASQFGILSKTLSTITTEGCLTALRTVFCGGFLLLIALIGL